MLSRMLLMTATCLALGWWAWPRPVEVVALLHAPSAPRMLGQPGLMVGLPFIDVQHELLTTLNDPELMTDTVAIVGNGKLRMFRGRRDPELWLRDRLEIAVLPKDVVSIKLRVPAQFQSDAIECLDYIALRVSTRVNVALVVELKNGTRMLPNGVSADSPRILQLATVKNTR